MKRLLLVIPLLFATMALNAQNPNKYAVWFKRGGYIECVSYSHPDDTTIAVTTADGETTIYTMEWVEKITSLSAETAARETAVIQLEEFDDTAPRGTSITTHAASSTGNVRILQTQRNQVVVPEVRIQTYYKEPLVAGALSFFIPGMGQIYNGDIAAGLGFLIGIPVFFVASITGSVAANSPLMFTAGIAGTIFLYIWNIGNAVTRASQINIMNGYAFSGGKLNFSPSLLTSNNRTKGQSYHYGMTLSLTF